MQTHLFQRYSQKENVDTANAMFLLARLKAYSSKKFYNVMQEILGLSNNFETMITMQTRGKKSIPDAVIFQDSFKILIETKRGDCFSEKQLKNHLEIFEDSNESYKALIALSNKSAGEAFDKDMEEYSKTKGVIYKHLSFEGLCDIVSQEIDEVKDTEFWEIIEDYRNYCFEDGLIDQEWKWLNVRSCVGTKDINLRLNLYYCALTAGPVKGYRYLGLYDDKRVVAIGQISHKIKAGFNDKGEFVFLETHGKMTEDIERRIFEVIEEVGKKEQYYVLVDEFYPTDFIKKSKRGLFGAKAFDLTQFLDKDVLDKNNKNPGAMIIAEKLKGKIWE